MNRLGLVAAVVALGVLAVTARNQHRRPPVAGGCRQRRLPVDAVERHQRERGLPQPDRQGLPGLGEPDPGPAREHDVLPDRIKAESDAGKGTVGLLGGVRGDFPTLIPYLTDLSDVAGIRRPASRLQLFNTLGRTSGLTHPVDAGDVRHGRKRSGSATCRRAPFVNWLRASRGPSLQAHKIRGKSARPASSTATSRSTDPRVHRPSEHVVQEQVGGLGLALYAAALEVRAPAVADLQLHAGPAPVRRGHGGLGSRRADRQRVARPSR